VCFSATASLVAGSTLTAGGSIVLKQARSRPEVPLALIPLLFGIQQLSEGVVWLSFSSPDLNAAATYTFSMFSHVLWPIFVPFAVLMLEGDPRRRRILQGLLAVGVSVGAYLLFYILKDGITAQVTGGSIEYKSPHLYVPLVLALYVLATCVSGLISSHPAIRVLGAVMLASFAVTGVLFSTVFISVWCFFAAVLSVVVYLHLRHQTGAIVSPSAPPAFGHP
jgi:hypothetical protein